jgi:hypothetical protein
MSGFQLYTQLAPLHQNMRPPHVRSTKKRGSRQAAELPARGLSRQPGLAAWTAPAEAAGMKPSPDPSYRHRFSAEIISQAVWLYHVFSLRTMPCGRKYLGALGRLSATSFRKELS